ncbi:MAG: hypothetical protein E6J90_07875 [Deltaproteobacteria bacterium]|nr:MAG: hypothetical protein E6J91_02520 [Deltaproteobacteria bacterium]TMQ24583.1 MAG: hypothetical protein E6J90_07875 [Deltaproteobacteria bacterium]
MGISTAGSREINVTPLIDVLLVLLVIFLLIMPSMLKFLTVEVPPKSGDVSEALSLELKLEADLSVSIDGGSAFPYRELAARLRGQLPKVSAVFIDAVDGLPWNLVTSTVDTVHGIADSNVRVAIRIRGG